MEAASQEEQETDDDQNATECDEDFAEVGHIEQSSAKVVMVCFAAVQAYSAAVKKSRKKWIPVAVFWCVFVLSVVLAQYFWWIGTIWTVLLLLVVVCVSVHSVLNAGRDENGTAFQGGYPKWFLRFAFDEEQKSKRNSKSS